MNQRFISKLFFHKFKDWHVSISFPDTDSKMSSKVHIEQSVSEITSINKS